MKNHVNKATHNLGHTIDLVIDCDENYIIGNVHVEPQNTISDHIVVNFKQIVDDIAKNKEVIKFCNNIPIDVTDFSNHLLTEYEQLLSGNCAHLTNISPLCASCKSTFYRIEASSYINQKAP